MLSELLGERRAGSLCALGEPGGAIATPGPATVKYGGHTVCTEVRCGRQLLIFDAGTGIGALGVSWVEEFADKPICGHIFVGDAQIFRVQMDGDYFSVRLSEQAHLKFSELESVVDLCFLAREGMSVEL